MGTTVRDLIDAGRRRARRRGGRRGAAGRGVVELHRPGQAGPARWTSAPLAEAGTMLGSGALVVLAEGTDLLAASTNVLRFFRNESCGKCVPCRVGSTKAHTILRDVAGLRAPTGRRRGGRGSCGWRRPCARPRSAGSARSRSGPVVSGARAGQGRCRGPAATPARRARGAAGPVSGREFFTARTVAEALAGFRPARPHRRRGRRRSPTRCTGCRPRTCASPAALPGFARSTVDGYAVRAADTYGASDGLPSYLDLARRGADGRGARRSPCGRAAASRCRPGGCCPTGPTRW